MIDVHCHLNFHRFKDDTPAVVERAKMAGVTRIINAGTQVTSSREAVILSEQYQDLYAIVGVHPHHADKVAPGWDKEILELAKHPKVLGIGEIGLDYYNYQSNGIVDPKLQRQIFERQIEIAHESHLPLQIHNRQAGEDVIGILKAHKDLLQDVPGMFHCFAGDMKILKSALQMGFYIGFDGNITYPGLAVGETVELRELARLVPLDRLIVETDAPYLTPLPHRGKRNEPSYAIITAKFIADLKGIPFETLVEQTDQNVYTVFDKLR